MMITDAINSVLDKLFICNIGYVFKYILKVPSLHLNNIRWSNTYKLSISSSFLVYCNLRCSLDGNLVKSG